MDIYLSHTYIIHINTRSYTLVYHLYKHKLNNHPQLLNQFLQPFISLYPNRKSLLCTSQRMRSLMAASTPSGPSGCIRCAAHVVLDGHALCPTRATYQRRAHPLLTRSCSWMLFLKLGWGIGASSRLLLLFFFFFPVVLCVTLHLFTIYSIVVFLQLFNHLFICFFVIPKT